MVNVRHVTYFCQYGGFYKCQSCGPLVTEYESRWVFCVSVKLVSGQLYVMMMSQDSSLFLSPSAPIKRKEGDDDPVHHYFILFYLPRCLLGSTHTGTLTHPGSQTYTHYTSTRTYRQNRFTYSEKRRAAQPRSIYNLYTKHWLWCLGM